MFALDSTVMVLVDVQERLAPEIAHMEACNHNITRLLSASAVLDIPLLVTEQYPEGLGGTTAELSVLIGEAVPVISKTTFSCFGEPDFCAQMTKKQYQTVVLFGIEAHVCVFQTALDARKKGYDVIVIADAVSSRTEQNKQYAIEQMRQEGIRIFSTEMFLFMALKDAKHPRFRAILELLK